MKILFRNKQKNKYINEAQVRALNEQADLQGNTIILIGDSQMIGGRKGDWTSKHMGPKLESLLTARGAKVIRLAKGGTGTSFWNKVLEGRGSGPAKKYTMEYLKQLNPTRIILSLGENDSARGGYGKNEKVMRRFFKKNAEPLMQKLKSITPNITWFGPGHRFESAKGSKSDKLKRGRMLTDQFLNEFAQQTGVSYVPMLNWVSKDERFKGLKPKDIRYDKVHYKDDAAQYYAEAIAGKVAAPGAVIPTAAAVTAPTVTTTAALTTPIVAGATGTIATAPVTPSATRTIDVGRPAPTQGSSAAPPAPSAKKTTPVTTTDTTEKHQKAKAAQTKLDAAIKKYNLWGRKDKHSQELKDADKVIQTWRNKIISLGYKPGSIPASPLQEWNIFMADLMPEKTDDEILEESVQLIQKTKQLLSEDWASRWLPRWMGGGSNETPTWIPNILGKGSLIAPGEGISLQDKEQYISPEMMDVVQRNNPDLDLGTMEGFEAAMRKGGMTGEQAKAETEEYFETGMAGVETAAALALLLPAAAAAAPAAAGASATTAGVGATTTTAAGEVAAGTALRTGVLGVGRSVGGGALRTGAARAISPAARASRLASVQAVKNMPRASLSMVTKNVTKLPQATGWAKNAWKTIWNPATRKWYGRYVMLEIAASELAPQFYDKYLKYVDPYHYAWGIMQSTRIAPWLFGEEEPIFFGRDPNAASILGLDEYMPWYKENEAITEDLANELGAAAEDLKEAMEECAGKTPCPKAEAANTRRIEIVEKMKEHSAEEYNQYIEASKQIDADIAAGTFKGPSAEGAPGEEAVPTEEPTTHSTDAPAVYAYGTEVEKAHYEQLRQKDPAEYEPGDEEFLDLYTHGGEEEGEA